MFLTLGLIIGFVIGWFANDKLEDLKAFTKKLNPFK